MDFRVDVDTWFVFSILFIGALSHLMLVYIVLPYFVRRKQISRLRVRFLNRISVNERFEKRALDHQFSDLQQRNTVLESDLRTSLQHLLHTSRTSGHYASFYAEFDLAYPDFTKKMHVIVPNITAHELKFCSLLRMNLSAKEMGAIMNITPASVNKARYRMREKLGLEQGEDLDVFLLSI